LDSFLNLTEIGKVKFDQPVRYAISDRRSKPGIDVDRYLEGLFRSTADIIQWREKDLSGLDNRGYIKTGVALSRQFSKIFLVNSDLNLALEEGADGIHISSNQDLAEVLDAVGGNNPDFIIGKSTHSIEEAVSAEAEGAHYVTLSPIYEPYSKEADHGLLGLTTLRSAAQILSIPVFALGGVDLSRMDVVCAAGAAGIAGISWIIDELNHSGSI
jgi:thiamine-phosphate pyrophosphorylase